MANLKVTLVRSVIGRPQNQRDIVKGLGLGRVNSSVVVPDNAAMRGVIRKINHLVDVELAKYSIFSLIRRCQPDEIT